MTDIKPLPCPFCGNVMVKTPSGIYQHFHRAQLFSGDCLLVDMHFEEEDIPLWNMRISVKQKKRHE